MTLGDIANAAVFLASEEAKYITAVALSVVIVVTAAAAGALVSTTMLSAAESAPTLPAASVACAVTA